MGFESFLGNERLKENLTGSLRRGHISHFYLICGPVGSGKHTLAQLLAAAILCGRENAPCGHCTACLGLSAHLPPAPALPPYDAAAFCPPEKPMPEFDRPAQRRRFLLGLLSPGLMARRLWAHPAYATATGHPWETL